MKLTYQTATGTLIQFITLSFLNMATGLDSIISTCRHESSDCTNNLVTSIAFYIIAVLWFGAVWLLGYLAQNRRNKRLCQLLICAELAIIMGAYVINIKNSTQNALSLITSIVDIALALWVITLAFRLMRISGSGNLFNSNQNRPRQRVRKSTSSRG